MLVIDAQRIDEVIAAEIARWSEVCLRFGG
jgi:hypothetical protein